MSKKSTIHNPVNFNPADYSIVDYFDNHRPEYLFGMPLEMWKMEIKEWEAERNRLFPSWNCHRCQHCGNSNVRYVVAVDHVPTGDRVCFGCDCVERLDFPNHDAFRVEKIRSAASIRNKAEKLSRDQQAFCEKHPDFAEAIKTIDNPVHERNGFAHDIIGKFRHYGTISDRQRECLVSSLRRDVEFAARREAEKAAITGTAPSGRCEIEGEIVSTKVQENDFGTTCKMLVRRDDGVKFWVSIPNSLFDDAHQTMDSLRANRVKLTATWEPSRNDPAFCFGKRPSKAAIVSK